MRKSGAIILSFAILLQLVAIGALVAVGTFQGKKGAVPKNYMLLLDVSSIKNTQNSTGLPDAGDDAHLKDFFAIYMLNYCSGQKEQGKFTIDYCSNANGKELFDYTDHDWEDFGVDFLNATGITPRSLTKRKGGGGRSSSSSSSSGGRSSSSSSSSKGSSSSKSKSKSKSLSPKTKKAKKQAKTKNAAPVYAVSFASTFFFRVFVMVISVTNAATVFGLAAIWFFWSCIVAGLLCWMAMFSAIALAADPGDYYKKFGGFLKTYKGPNGTTVSFKVGTTPFMILWVMFTMLILSSIAWLVCFFLLAPAKKQKTVDATADEEANNAAEEDRDFDIKQDVQVQTAPITPAPTDSFVAKFKNLSVKLLSMNGTKAKQADYEPVQGGGYGGMQQDTSYVSPGMSSYEAASAPAHIQQAHANPAYEPMRTQ